MMREWGRSVGEAVAEHVGRAVGQTQERRPLPADLLESDDAYLVVFDAPGAEASDVQVRYADGAVEVRVDRFREYREGYDMRFPGRGVTLDGQVRLPDDAPVDPTDAEATLTDVGELQVRVPKADSAPVDDEERVSAAEEETPNEDDGDTAEGA